MWTATALKTFAIIALLPSTQNSKTEIRMVSAMSAMLKQAETPMFKTFVAITTETAYSIETTTAYSSVIRNRKIGTKIGSVMPVMSDSIQTSFESSLVLINPKHRIARALTHESRVRNKQRNLNC